MTDGDYPTLFPDDDSYPRDLYGGTPPHEDVDTSAWAAESVRHTAPKARAKVVAAFAQHGPLTCEQVEQVTGMSHQSCSARIREAVQKDEIVWTGDYRKGSSGRMQRVYKAA